MKEDGDEGEYGRRQKPVQHTGDPDRNFDEG
jgi:hypothetical protein